ncbi:hypothetical protein KCP76_25185 [Salmonella enterica subsp. enterica serovar Weltevreden]|nr:hypothetical protein KCP76_25185 [Salmonella enterica subsp. enterica serovar Weltevreden]
MCWALLRAWDVKVRHLAKQHVTIKTRFILRLLRNGGGWRFMTSRM